MSCKQSVSLLTLFLCLSTQACFRDADAASEKEPHATAAARPATAADGTVLELGGCFGSPAALWCEVSYKVKRKSGVLTKSLEIEVDNAAPGTTHSVTVDNFAIGNLATNAKGDAKLELVENKELLFPQGFQQPAPGSVIRIGDVLQVRLERLVRLAGLEAVIAGAGKFGGKATYKVEQLGDTVTKEFVVKVTGAPPKGSLAVTLDGVALGNLAIDVEGQGRIKFSTKKPPPFPDAFREPKAGTPFRIGDLFAGTLQDAK